MDETGGLPLRRRDLLLAAAAVGTASAAVVVAPGAGTRSAGNRGKRKSQYQANSPEVQSFYRVNRYPVK